MQIRLRNFREHKGITQKQMAKLLGVSKSYYIKVEEGYRNPSYNFLRKIKSCFDINLDDTFFS